MPLVSINLYQGASMASTQDLIVTVLKSGTCPSLSGRSKLAFEFGTDSQSTWHVRIAKSSGTGYFSKAWTPLEHVQRVLQKNATKPVTCHTLGPVFKGQSVNTAGFVLAALKHVGLVEPCADNPRAYQVTDGKAFFTELAVACKSSTPKKKTASAAAKG
jgi:hypothetical protein